VHVPAGSLVIISPWIVHRHASAWSRPDEFLPSRFAEGGKATRTAFIPFGAGPRMCIGRDFAYAEAVLALAMVCRAVRLEPSGAPVRPVPLVTIRPESPALMRVVARSSASHGVA
jgi:cytochrome P450